MNSIIIWSFPFISLSSWATHLDNSWPLVEKWCPSHLCVGPECLACLGNGPLDPQGTLKCQLSPLYLREHLGQSWPPPQLCLLVQNALAWSLVQTYWPWSPKSGPPAPIDSSCGGCRVCPESPCISYKLSTWRGYPSPQSVSATYGYTYVGTAYWHNCMCSTHMSSWKGNKKTPLLSFEHLGSPGRRYPLHPCLVGSKCGLCPWQTLLPYIRFHLIIVYNISGFLCNRTLVVDCRQAFIHYCGLHQVWGRTEKLCLILFLTGSQSMLRTC